MASLCQSIDHTREQAVAKKTHSLALCCPQSSKVWDYFTQRHNMLLEGFVKMAVTARQHRPV